MELELGLSFTTASRSSAIWRPFLNLTSNQEIDPWSSLMLLVRALSLAHWLVLRLQALKLINPLWVFSVGHHIDIGQLTIVRSGYLWSPSFCFSVCFRYLCATQLGIHAFGRKFLGETLRHMLSALLMWTQRSTFGIFANAQNVLVTGGTFVSIIRSYGELFSHNFPQVTAQNYNLPVNTSEAQMKTPVPQKLNPSPLFTGQKDVLDRLGRIFQVDHINNRPRRCCLLWGMGGIRKTQICLKFTEEMSDR